jgi:hypothetical protein
MAIPCVRELLLAWGTLLCLAGAACSSNQDDVCENVGACAQGGSSDWIASCKDEAKRLRDEASTNGCLGLFDAYYDCAASSFTCKGITASFPGCETPRAPLETCLGAAEAKTSCKELTAKTTACAAASADAGPADGGTLGLAPACTVSRDCQARCYLDHVINPCAPLLDELSGVAACSNSCPP